MPTRVAACVCEQLTVSSSGDPTHVSLCHCLSCQRRTGSTYGIAAFYPRENVRVAGDATAYTRQPSTSAPIAGRPCTGSSVVNPGGGRRGRLRGSGVCGTLSSRLSRTQA
jgi:hypothetical protein